MTKDTRPDLHEKIDAKLQSTEISVVDFLDEEDDESVVLDLSSCDNDGEASTQALRLLR
jgi:hypothetical protein